MNPENQWQEIRARLQRISDELDGLRQFVKKVTERIDSLAPLAKGKHDTSDRSG